MFIMGCQDSVTAVSVAAMQSTSAYINALSDDPMVMQLQCVLTPMLGVMHACLLRGDDVFPSGELVVLICVFLFLSYTFIHFYF